MSDPSQTDRRQQAADFCLEHLHREADLLEGCFGALSAVRGALRDGDGEQLLEAIQQQQASEVQLASMSARRADLSGRLAGALELPVQRATVLGLIRRLDDGATRSQLDSARKRAQSAARQVERLCRGNAALIAHRIDLMRRMLAALGSAGPATYEPQGIAPAPPRSTMQRDC